MMTCPSAADICINLTIRPTLSPFFGNGQLTEPAFTISGRMTSRCIVDVQSAEPRPSKCNVNVACVSNAGAWDRDLPHDANRGDHASTDATVSTPFNLRGATSGSTSRQFPEAV